MTKKTKTDTVEAGAGLMHVSTDADCAHDKVAFWADMVCQHLVQVECNSVIAPEQFHGAIGMRRIDKVDVAQIVAGAQQVTRTQGMMARADSEYFLVNIQRDGNSSVQQDGRRATLKPGDMAVYSSARRYDLAFNATFSQTVLTLPANELRLKIPGIDALTATTLGSQNPAVRLLTRMASNCYQTEFDALPPAAGACAANALTELLAAAAAAFSPAPEKNISNLALFHLTRIKQHVIDHLHDPALSIDTVSQKLRISPAHIHRLFEGELQTFSVWLWSCRLIACKRDLENYTKTHLSVSEIAFQNGFSNSSHFSRTFRAKFGISPRECRDRQVLTRTE
jgi:AraC-like DNA-binding protein